MNGLVHNDDTEVGTFPIPEENVEIEMEVWGLDFEEHKHTSTLWLLIWAWLVTKRQYS